MLGFINRHVSTRNMTIYEDLPHCGTLRLAYKSVRGSMTRSVKIAF
jgi:hypothetical protein